MIKNIETFKTLSCCFLKHKRKQCDCQYRTKYFLSYALRISYLWCDGHFYVRYRNHTSHKVAPLPMTRTCGHISSYFGRNIGASFMWPSVGTLDAYSTNKSIRILKVKSSLVWCLKFMYFHCYSDIFIDFVTKSPKYSIKAFPTVLRKNWLYITSLKSKPKSPFNVSKNNMISIELVSLPVQNSRIWLPIRKQLDFS